jgi:AcrR family transcriptional regulator
MVQSISEIRRDEITDAVLKILALQGPSAISMQAIADTVGLAKSSLYHHFASAEELIDAALEKGQRILINSFHTAVGQASSPFRALISFMSDVNTQSTPAVAFERVVNYSNGGAANPWSERVIKFHAEIKEKLHSLVQAAQASREVRDDINAYDIATTLMSMLVYQFIIHRVEGNPDGLTMGVGSAIKIFTKLVARHA